MANGTDGRGGALRAPGRCCLLPDDSPGRPGSRGTPTGTLKLEAHAPEENLAEAASERMLPGGPSATFGESGRTHTE